MATCWPPALASVHTRSAAARPVAALPPRPRPAVRRGPLRVRGAAAAPDPEDEQYGGGGGNDADAGPALPRIPRSSPGDFAAGWKNPFRDRKKEEDAAKSLIKDTFKDKGDPLAAYDPGAGGGDDGGSGRGRGRGWGKDGGGSGGSGGSGDGGGGDGGDGGDGQGGINWQSAGAGALNRARSTGKTLGALALVLGGLAVLPFYKQVIFLTTSFISWVLRLDARGPRAVAAIRAEARRAALEAADPAAFAELGQWEVEALSRYGPEPDGGDGSLAAWRAAKKSLKGQVRTARVRAAETAAAAEAEAKAAAAARAAAAREQQQAAGAAAAGKAAKAGAGKASFLASVDSEEDYGDELSDDDY